jgi:hypothetical protein
MLAVLNSLGMFIIDVFKSRRRLEAENLVLRRQLGIALRRAPPRLRLRGSDRALLAWITRLAEACPYQKPHPGLKRDEQHVGHLETHAHPA